MICGTSKYLAFAFLDPSIIFSHKVVVIARQEWDDFGVLQSRCHDIWAKFFGSSLEDRPVYTSTDCFQTFPFPASQPSETVCRAFYEHRSQVMQAFNEGFTDIYNRFHEPHETSPEIKKLRELHDEMDRAVLAAYGWNVLANRATCEFLLEYEEEEDDDPTAKKSKRKEPWRYRWPDEFRDEVLARLLELNGQRAKEEKLAGKTAEAKAKSDGSSKRGRRPSKKKEEPRLF